MLTKKLNYKVSGTFVQDLIIRQMQKAAMKREENTMLLEKRLQEKILNTIDEMALIQAYVYRETNLDRIDAAKDDYFDQLNILRILLSIQIPDRKERNAVVDYIREGIFDREWRKYVTEVETRG